MAGNDGKRPVAKKRPLPVTTPPAAATPPATPAEETAESYKGNKKTLRKQLEDGTEALTENQEAWKQTSKAILKSIGLTTEQIVVVERLIKVYTGATSAQKAFGGGIVMTATALEMKTKLLRGAISKLTSITMDNVFALDEARTSMAELTGQGTRWSDSVLSIRNANRHLGVTFEDSANAIGGLHNNMTMISQLSAGQVEEVATLSSAWQKLGVSNETTGKIQDSLMKGMGYKLPKALKIQKNLLETAVKLNIPVARMAEDFESSLAQLGGWGKEAPKIFKKVEMAAHTLGVKLDDLLSTASQFDTFEGSAAAVGKLNAILQTDFLNPYEMMGLDEEQKIRKINEAIELSGVNFDHLTGAAGRALKQAIGDAVQMKNMDKLNKTFGQGLAAYDKGQDKLKDTASEVNKLGKSIEATLSASEKMKQIGNDFAVGLEPIINGINDLLTGIMGLNLHTKKISDYPGFWENQLKPMIERRSGHTFDSETGEVRALTKAEKRRLGPVRANVSPNSPPISSTEKAPIPKQSGLDTHDWDRKFYELTKAIAGENKEYKFFLDGKPIYANVKEELKTDYRLKLAEDL